MPKIDVLLPVESRYGVLQHFSESLSKAFKKLGCSVRLLSGDDCVLKPLADPPDFTISFNGAPQDEEGIFLSELIEVPHLACLVDPPYRFHYLLNSPYLIVGCDDKKNCSELIKWGFDKVVFIPQAVDSSVFEYPEQVRDFGISFFGSYIDAEAIRKLWKEQLSPTIYDAVEKTAECFLHDPEATFESAATLFLYPAIRKKPFDQRFFYSLMEQIELYVKGKSRCELLKDLAGQPLHVFGGSLGKRSWEDFFSKYPHVKIHPEIPYEKTFDVMRRSKIVLNSSIKNKEGAHERIFSGAACGAVVATNENPYLSSEFGCGEMLFYQEGFSGLNDSLAGLLKDESTRKAMAERAQKTTFERHTWEVRAQDILDKLVN